MAITEAGIFFLAGVWRVTGDRAFSRGEKLVIVTLLGVRCVWALLGTGLLLGGTVDATTTSGDRVNIQLDNISVGE